MNLEQTLELVATTWCVELVCTALDSDFLLAQIIVVLGKDSTLALSSDSRSFHLKVVNISSRVEFWHTRQWSKVWRGVINDSARNILHGISILKWGMR